MPIRGLRPKPALLRGAGAAELALNLSILTAIQTKFSAATATPEHQQPLDAMANCWLLLNSHQKSVQHLGDIAVMETSRACCIIIGILSAKNNTFSYILLGTTEGSAFCPLSNFNPSILKSCNVCYSGSPSVV
jgi:hypothetical protein